MIQCFYVFHYLSNNIFETIFSNFLKDLSLYIHKKSNLCNFTKILNGSNLKCLIKTRWKRRFLLAAHRQSIKFNNFKYSKFMLCKLINCIFKYIKIRHTFRRIIIFFSWLYMHFSNQELESHPAQDAGHRRTKTSTKFYHRGNHLLSYIRRSQRRITRKGNGENSNSCLFQPLRIK